MTEDIKKAFLLLNQRPIAYYPVYRVITGSTSAAAFLSQIMYWHSKMKGKEFYKSDEEIMDETFLTQKEIRNAKERLKSTSFIRIYSKCPKGSSTPKTHYQVDDEALINCVAKNKLAEGIENMLHEKKQKRKQKSVAIGSTSPKGQSVESGEHFAQRAKSISPKGQKAFRPKGKNSIYTKDYNSRLLQEKGTREKNSLENPTVEQDTIQPNCDIVKEFSEKEKNSGKKEKEVITAFSVFEKVKDFFKTEYGSNIWNQTKYGYIGSKEQSEREILECLNFCEKQGKKFVLQIVNENPETIRTHLTSHYGHQWVKERGKKSLENEGRRTQKNKHLVSEEQTKRVVARAELRRAQRNREIYG